MAQRFALEALKTALIASIKKQKPEGIVCKQCDAPFETIHVVSIPFGYDKLRVCLCEHCLYELKEFIQMKEQSQYSDVFGESIRLLMGQSESMSHIEYDTDDAGSYYDTAKYKMDHL